MSVKHVIHTCIIILIITHFPGGCACGTYCTFGHPVPVGICIHSGVILLACLLCLYNFAGVPPPPPSPSSSPSPVSTLDQSNIKDGRHKRSNPSVQVAF